MRAAHSLPLAAVAVIAASATGVGVVMRPQVAFLLTVAFICALTIAAPAGTWVLAALVSALTFKGLVTLGVLPSVATFIDLPLAWGALCVALLKQNEHSPFLRRHFRWIVGLGLAVLLAWLFNRSEILRPILYLMLLAEPFVIVGALLADPPSARMRRALEWTLLTLILVQIPLAALQFVTLGPADRVQGTLYGAGAGAHVMSAVAVVGAIWLLSGGLGSRVLGVWRLPVVGALFVIPFLADAKQVIVALPAILLASTFRGGRFQFFLRSSLALTSVVVLYMVIPAGKAAETFIHQTQRGNGGKEAAASFVWTKLNRDAASLTFGKGPAETVSRAAFLTTPSFQGSGFQYASSPLATLGLRPASIATEAQRAAISQSGGRTSFNTGVSSALGVLGDLGVLGAIAYLGLLLSLFLRLRRETSPEGVAGAAGFAMFIVLGLVFDWWEQPPFGVFIGVLAGLSLAASQFGSRDAPRLDIKPVSATARDFVGA